MPEDRMLNWKQIMDITGLSRSKVYQLMHSEDGFPTHNLDGALRVWKSDLLEWIERQRLRRPTMTPVRRNAA